MTEITTQKNGEAEVDLGRDIERETTRLVTPRVKMIPSMNIDENAIDTETATDVDTEATISPGNGTEITMKSIQVEGAVIQSEES